MKNYIAVVLIAIFLLVGCSNKGKLADKYEGKAAYEIYKIGKLALDRGDYENAIKAYHGLEANHPFGEYTMQSQLDIIYAHTKFAEPSAAIFAADRFIRLHPSFNELDYVYYMKGIAKFNESTSVLERFFPIDPTKRDVTPEREAFAYFAEFLNKYPQSKYAADARQRMVYLRNNIAKHELAAGDYYYKRGAFLASANRALNIIQNYDRTNALPDALLLLVNSYKKMELYDLAKDANDVLIMNYPNYAEKVKT